MDIEVVQCPPWWLKKKRRRGGEDAELDNGEKGIQKLNTVVSKKETFTRELDLINLQSINSRRRITAIEHVYARNMRDVP